MCGYQNTVKYLGQCIKTELRHLTFEIAEQFGFEVLALEITPDYIPLSLSAPPSPAEIIRILREQPLENLEPNFLICAMQNNCERTVFYAMHVNVSAETIRRYIVSYHHYLLLPFLPPSIDLLTFWLLLLLSCRLSQSLPPLPSLRFLP